MPDIGAQRLSLGGRDGEVGWVEAVSSLFIPTSRNTQGHRGSSDCHDFALLSGENQNKRLYDVSKCSVFKKPTYIVTVAPPRHTAVAWAHVICVWGGWRK